MSHSADSTTPHRARVNYVDVLERKCAPVFTPRTDAMNCDPTYELEEHIIESSPIHSRKARARSAQDSIGRRDVQAGGELAHINETFNVYNREGVLKLMDKHVAALVAKQVYRNPQSLTLTFR